MTIKMMMQSRFVNCFAIIGHSGHHEFHENTLHVRVLCFLQTKKNDNIHYCRIEFTFPILYV
jgi:hypothetical protein